MLFCLNLPPREVTNPVLTTMSDKLISSITESIGVWQGKSFLIVEDVTSNYYFLEATLKKSGAEITWVRSGEEALDLINKNVRFDLILMDVQLTGVDGYEVTRKIKQIKPDLPIIAQTAYAMIGEKEKSQNAGCDEYLSKPIRPVLLLQTISKFV